MTRKSAQIPFRVRCETCVSDATEYYDIGYDKALAMEAV